MTLVLVDQYALGQLIREMYDLRLSAAEMVVNDGMVEYLDPRDELVTLAVQAGLPLPGPMQPGTAPPPPPEQLPASNVAPVHRAPDGRLRCTECGKVVYTSLSKAEHAASTISRREAMRAYHGRCGHYHVSRVRK